MVFAAGKSTLCCQLIRNSILWAGLAAYHHDPSIHQHVCKQGQILYFCSSPQPHLARVYSSAPRCGAQRQRRAWPGTR
jgi:hypothetical protein